MRSPIKDLGPTFYNTLSTLKQIIPEGTVTSSFLFFAGNLEFNLAEANRSIHAYTTRYVVYEFWKYVEEDPRHVREIVNFIMERSERDERLFTTFQKEWLNCRDPFMRSAMFFVLNRSSSTGHLSSGTHEEDGVNAINLSYLNNFNPVNFNINWVQEEDFLVMLDEQKIKGDYFLIPAGKFNYNFFEEGKNKGIEETTVQHKELFECVQQLKQRTILLYQFHPAILKLYKDFNVRMIDEYGRQISKREECKDLIITNF